MESGGKNEGNKKMLMTLQISAVLYGELKNGTVLAGMYACVCVRKIQNKVGGHLLYYICI